MGRLERRAYHETRLQKQRRDLKELDELYSRRYSLGYVKLDPPRWEGYARKLFLRDGLSPDMQARLIPILNLINNEQRCENKDFIITRRIFKNRRRKHSVSELYEYHPNAIKKTELDKLTAEQRQYFSFYWWTVGWGYTWEEYTIRQSVMNLYFELRVYKYYVTEDRVFDPDLDYQITWLYRQIHWYGKQVKGDSRWRYHRYHGDAWWYSEKQYFDRKRTKKEMWIALRGGTDDTENQVSNNSKIKYQSDLAIRLSTPWKMV